MVNTTTDSSYGILSAPGELSLRQAIGLANFLGGIQTITFDSTVFATHQTIALTAGAFELSDMSGLETIAGPAAGVTINAGGQSRAFQVDGGVTASLSGLTITDGSTSGIGGGLYNIGTVTLTDCTVSGNSASTGGGVFNLGTATLSDSTISGNSASYVAGGLWNYGTATLTDCTVSGNSAGSGGGVYSIGPMTLIACTVSANSAEFGGGVNLVRGLNSQATIGDTIVAGNAAGLVGPDIFGTVTLDRGFNLVGDGSGASGIGAAGDQVGTAGGPTDPRLAPLGDYGGPTQTMLLLPGSPAIGTGAVLGQTKDQRGFALDSPRPDIGAFQRTPLVVTTTSDETDSSLGLLSLRLALNLATILGGPETITFDPTVFATHQTIALLAGTLELGDTGGLETITAPAAGVTISGAGLSGVFQVDSGVTASLSGLTVTSSGPGNGGNGGGLANFGTVTLTGCTISGNSAKLGGGVYNDGTATFVDCTISGNSSEFGGGVYNNGTATFTACTIYGNSGFLGGGVALPGDPSSLERLTIGDTIIARNSAEVGPDISGTVMTDRGFNLIGNGSGASGFTAVGDQVGTAAGPIDPRLAPLGDYGGPTPTMALLAGSRAIGTGAALGQTTDQRGFALDSPVPDIGAFQTQSKFVVTDATDGAGQLLPLGHLSLRQAVNLADIMGVAAIISFDPTAFAAHQTITLTSGQLELSDQGGLQTITGPAAGVTISAGGKSRVFQVDGGVTASLSGLTITGGSTSGNGGGLENLGTVALTDCTVSGNSAGNGGGGIANFPSAIATLTDCIVSANSAANGGGIANSRYAQVTLTDSTISNNSASSYGGGIYTNNSLATLTGCTISGNSASTGGGGLNEENYSLATLTDCTVAGNSAVFGGGVRVDGLETQSLLTLTACTISGNSATTGGGIGLFEIFATAPLTIGDTIVAGNTAQTGPDISGAATDDLGYNLIGLGDGTSGFTAAGDQVGTAAKPISPFLAPLGDYGGPTQTIALLPGSPAIGTGIAVAGLTTDQRGFALDSPVPDIGAFQTQSKLVVTDATDGAGNSCRWATSAFGRRSTWPTSWASPPSSASTRPRSRPTRRSL